MSDIHNRPDTTSNDRYYLGPVPWAARGYILHKGNCPFLWGRRYFRYLGKFSSADHVVSRLALVKLNISKCNFCCNAGRKVNGQPFTQKMLSYIEMSNTASLRRKRIPVEFIAGVN